MRKYSMDQLVIGIISEFQLKSVCGKNFSSAGCGGDTQAIRKRKGETHVSDSKAGKG
jgi:hypothetical protein